MIKRMKDNNDKQMNSDITDNRGDLKRRSDEGEMKEPESVEKDELMNQESGAEERKRGKHGEGDKQEDMSQALSSEADVENLERDFEIDEEFKKARQEIEDLKDILQRRQADFENYKKRLAKDREEQKKLAIRDLALDIININDDLLRAVDAASNIPQGESLEHAHRAFADGVKMISKQIEDTLHKYKIVEIDALNKEFNPKFNEAVEIDMSEHVDRDTVTKIYQKGFMLDDLIIRSARVKVTKPMKVKEEVGNREEGMEEGFSDDNRGREVTNEEVGYD
jgi:molecular chaperone GrpE